MKVGDISQLEPNIHARVKYIRFVIDQYFKDEQMDRLNVERVAARRIGRETVQYVSNIYKYYVADQLAYAENQAKRSLEKP